MDLGYNCVSIIERLVCISFYWSVAMLWRISQSSSCVCESEGEEERRASVSITSRCGGFSEVGFHVRDVTLEDVVVCGGI